MTKEGAPASFACNCPPNDRCSNATSCSIAPAKDDSWKVVLVNSSLCAMTGAGSPSGYSSNEGANIGAGVGGALLVILGAAAVWYFLRKRRTAKALVGGSTSSPASASSTDTVRLNAPLTPPSCHAPPYPSGWMHPLP